MSLEPAVAAAIGFIALSQDLDAIEVLAISLVVIASAGALRSPQRRRVTEGEGHLLQTLNIEP